jgi:hypothetical protein
MQLYNILRYFFSFFPMVQIKATSLGLYLYLLSSISLTNLKDIDYSGLE